MLNLIYLGMLVGCFVAGWQANGRYRKDFEELGRVYDRNKPIHVRIAYRVVQMFNKIKK